MIDLILAVLLIGYAIGGYRNGAVVGFFSLAGFVGGGALAMWRLPKVLDRVRHDGGQTRQRAAPGRRRAGGRRRRAGRRLDGRQPAAQPGHAPAGARTARLGASVRWPAWSRSRCWSR